MFVRPRFDSAGPVTVADVDGIDQRVVADVGESPRWSPDAKQLAFSHCRPDEDESPNGSLVPQPRKCSLWTVPSDGHEQPQLLVDAAQSPPFWSPDGRFIAFLRQAARCETYCRFRIFIAPSSGGAAHPVGPELVEPAVEWSGWWSWPGIAWLPERASVLVPRKDKTSNDELELQRCVDIWNRAQMSRWPNGVMNVSIVNGLCQVTVSSYGAICTQEKDTQFRYWCPSHGAGLHMLPPESRVWNAHRDRSGELRLLDPPKGARLPLPKAPPYPLLEGFVVPFTKDGEALPSLKLTDVTGTCSWLPDPLDPHAAEGYPVRCGWGDYGNNDCFKRPGALKAGDIVLCPNYWYRKRSDPLSFFKVTVARLE